MGGTEERGRYEATDRLTTETRGCSLRKTSNTIYLYPSSQQRGSLPCSASSCLLPLTWASLEDPAALSHCHGHPLRILSSVSQSLRIPSAVDTHTMARTAYHARTHTSQRKKRLSSHMLQSGTAPPLTPPPPRAQRRKECAWCHPRFELCSVPTAHPPRAQRRHERFAPGGHARALAGECA